MSINISGLPIGMGATIGNFIRRSVLCQRVKWDIVGFSLNDLHEFSTVPESTDTLVEFLPKLKDLKFTLKSELENEIKAGTLVKFADTVSLYSAADSEGAHHTIIGITLISQCDEINSTLFNRWFVMSNEIEFCKMLKPIRVKLTLYLMQVQGFVSSEESYAYLCSAGLTEDMYTNADGKATHVICMPASNRGDLSVEFEYKEELNQEELTVTITPDNPNNRGIVREAVTASLEKVVEIIKRLT